MSLLIHVDVPLTNIDAVEGEIARCCKETQDLPIGRRVYEEVGEVLIVVLLAQDRHMGQHVRVLNEALQQHLILSFQFETTNLVTIHCEPSCPTICNVLRGFPLHPNESWFPAIDDTRRAYFCTRRLLMSPEQLDWLVGRNLKYTYL